MRTAAVLPVKRFVQAKQRLGESVADRLRLALAEAMVADVLLALSQATEVQHTIVVTREPSILDPARAHRATVIEDAAEAGQSAAAALGVAAAIEQGFARVLCVPGDCPALDPAELDAMLHAERDVPAPAVTIVPDRHGAGTNGLLLSPPDAIAPSFGPDSCERHRSLAAEAGIVARLTRPRSLLLDIDTGADLAVLRERLTTVQEGASRTRAVLGRPHRSDALSAVNA